jgi:endogenous inhibitor of DNA gyrase (YacG/DUF329 family)
MGSAPSPGFSAPQWVVSCPNCYLFFPHSEVAPRSTAFPYDWLYPVKPELPARGISMECPHCGTTSVFQTFNLMFRP